MALAVGPASGSVAANKAAGSMRKAMTPEPVGTNRPGKNWIEKSPLGHLPPYVQHVANELIKKGRSRSKAIEMAIGIVRNWSHGHTGSRGGSKPGRVQASTAAAAQYAMRQWGAMRKWAAGRRATKSTILITPLEDGDLIEYLDTLEDADMADLYALMQEHGPMEVIAPDDSAIEEDLVEDTDDDGDPPSTDGVEEPDDGGQVAGPIVMKNAANRVAYAAVLVPGEKDSDGDELTEEQIATKAWDFLENHRYMDEEHTLQDAVAVPVESYTLPQAMTVEFIGSSARAVKTKLPKGSWIMGARVREDKWGDVQSGKLAGLSSMGVRKSDYESAKRAALKSGDDEFAMTLRRVTFKDLGEDFIIPAVSLVGNPAVPKAKWFALKSADSEAPKKDSEAGGTGGIFGNWFGRGKSKEAGEDVSERDSEAEEVLEVEINREELDKQVEARVEAKLVELLGEGATDGSGDDAGDETLTFKNEEELNAHIEAQVAEYLEEIEAGDDDDEDSSQDSGGSREGAQESQVEERVEAAVKSAMEPYKDILEKLTTAKKGSSRIFGGVDQVDGDTETTYKALGRDNFGRKLPA
jgi:hypothetical protein